MVCRSQTKQQVEIELEREQVIPLIESVKIETGKRGRPRK